MQDTYRHKGLRRLLIEELMKEGISDNRVLEAMNQLPRHFFLDKAFEEIAYQNKAFQIAQGQTISHPFTVAYQTQLLNIQKREKVLEVGTGSGYQAAILSILGGRVYTVERIKELYLSAKSLFKELGLLGIRSYYRDGYKGLAEFTPFDKIIVTAAAPSIPLALKQQLKIGGTLIIPVGNNKGQRMMKITQPKEGVYEEVVLDNFQFVPMLKGKV